MSWSELLAFVVAAGLLVMSPGPNGVLVARTVPTSGRAAGFANILGFFVSFYIHGLLSIFGISLILMQSATAFTIVKFLGAAYLCWIGVKSLIAAWRHGRSIPTVKPARRKRTLVMAFLEGLLTNGLNPKVSLFYLAIFPQFLSVGADPVSTSLLLVFVHSMLNVIWFSSMVLMLSRLTAAARSGRFQRWLKGVTGAVFIGFGVKLATFRPAL